MKIITIQLIVILLVISALTFLSLVSMGAIDEGTQGEGLLGFIALVFSKLYYVFRFPTHTLFSQSFSSWLLFFVGLAINIIFWTTIIHMTIKYLKNWIERQQVTRHQTQ